ncbi:DAK2 domain-containing protein [Oribacterium sp. Sow4_G1_1]|uniref:DAK2 domain-containing protein n=1 Tax=Oribacterium sp. Sow4_G1_1 TaxID=3438794 RepID=UPI003F9A4F5D
MGDQIDALQLKNAFLAGANNLNAKKEWINELNVFPVPDGDTGTNMTMTIMSAAREVAAISAPTLENVAKAMASGSLRGARGNSGVILSQLIRGFTKEIREHADEAGIDNLIMARAFSRAVETAYKAVMKPKEGTILTVAKGMADRITELSVTDEDLITLLEKVVAYGDEVLAKTPEMLPVLKEAGVVDSGGQGLMTVVKGALASLKGEEVVLDLGDQGAAKAEAPVERKSRGEISTADIKFGYCTEFMVNGDHEFTDEEVDSLRAWLGGVGDSIVCFSDENIIKVHVHTNHPGNAFEKGLTMGYLSKMKVDNMRLEHHEVLIEDASRIAEEKKEEAASAAAPEKPEEPAKEYGFISVSAGDGLTEIFRGIGVDYVIEGGQTMNPSTEDILNACDQVNAETIFVLPNNKNIILAANQAKDIIEDKTIIVVPTKTIPQGITAMISFSPDMNPEENLEAMKDASQCVRTGEITYAVRNTTIDGHAIEKDDIMALGDDGLLAVAKEKDQAVLEALKAMVNDESEIITIYYGQDIPEEEAEAVAARIRKAYPQVETELQYGGQPIYYYFLSVE